MQQAEGLAPWPPPRAPADFTSKLSGFTSKNRLKKGKILGKTEDLR
jgi:hypothetical protein